MEVSRHCHSATTAPCSMLNLTVVAITYMNGGFCILGFRPETVAAAAGIQQPLRLLRPIRNWEAGKCCWPLTYNFIVGRSYAFADRHLGILTAFPHANEDICVEQEVKMIYDIPCFPLFELLYPYAKTTVDDIFGYGNVVVNRFVWPYTNCPSNGILAVPHERLAIVHENGKRRCTFMDDFKNVYNLSYTSTVHFCYPLEYLMAPKNKALIALGLGREWTPPNAAIGTPPKCALLALNVIFSSQ